MRAGVDANSWSKRSIYGIKADGEKVSLDSTGSIVLVAGTQTVFHFFGESNAVTLTFTKKRLEVGGNCTVADHSGVYMTSPAGDGVTTATDISLPAYKGYYYVCVFKDNRWIHQGSDPWLRVRVNAPVLPIPVQIVLIFILLTLSGLFSGLNLGLMALDKNELQVISRCGTDEEKRYANTIQPVRKRGNYLLCSLLLGNVLVNSSLTIILDDLTSGLIAVIGSTLSIVIFGEIIPQAICSRHGLAVGARTIYLTYLFMILTFPLSYPISKLLDRILGDEIGNVYDRERLMEYIKVTKTYNKLEEDEVNIISGALALKTKTVGEVMTRLEDVFMLPETAVLDFQTVSEIQRQGYSRIPVYRNNERRDIIGLLHAKDLAFVDPDDVPPTPLKTIIDYYKHPLIHVFEDDTLNNVLNNFKQGKSHMAFVVKIYGESDVDVDPYHEITGIVTLEDVIEEILQAEIVDETDVITDNRRKQRRKEIQTRQDFSDFAKIGEGHEGRSYVSPQMALATFQYLSTAVEPFGRQYISQVVLRRLIAQKVYYHVKIEDSDVVNQAQTLLYTAGKPADYFIMILEGRVKVIVGKECLEFESGPFTYFGVAALKIAEPIHKTSSGYSVSSSDVTQNVARPPSPDFSLNRSPSTSIQPQLQSTFTPDYTVRIVESTLYMKIPRKVYIAAYHASLLQKHKDLSQDDEKFREEVDTVFTCSLIERSTTPEVKHQHAIGPLPKERKTSKISSNHVSALSRDSSPTRLSSPQASLAVSSGHIHHRSSPSSGDSTVKLLGNGASFSSPFAGDRSSASSNEIILQNRSLPSSPDPEKKTYSHDSLRRSSKGSLNEVAHLINS
ncbi:metal transporter CNNM4-like protein [Dinothrombium tinctorium]|uniref:Metal transporter CNNM4-like protein n=1 Tax=Dinothrombium tinctorium TaxID=1965070 RepID=A0A3S3SQ56_9ACAR|nr:metal transporter CNNM4-like protein [Dinothrombium tinctorium]